jgi:hypothetical protein
MNERSLTMRRLGMKSDTKMGFAWASLFIGMVFLALFGGCTKPELEQVRISPQKVTLFPGESATFKAVALSASGQPISVENLKWSVEGDAGIVNGSGRFTAKRPGKATVVPQSRAAPAKLWSP